jgi:hypothetical protein
MAERSINEVIKNNSKISKNPFIVNDIKNRTKKVENDNSFKQLLSLQLLIQKYSGLKELCKKKIIFNLLI